MRLSPRAAERRIARTALISVLALLGLAGTANAATYSATVGSPLGYWKLDESAGAAIAANSGSLGSSADGAYRNSVRLGRQAAINCERRQHWGGFTTQGCQARGDAAGSSAYFSGAPYNAQVQVSSVPESLSYTLEAWVKPTVAGLDGGIVDHGDNGVLLLTGGKVRFVAHATDGNAVATDAGSLSLDTWHHVAASWDNATGTATLYVDGAVADTDTANPLDEFAASGSPSLFIGWTNQDGAAGLFRGYVDNVAYYGSALDVSSHYALGSAEPAGTGSVTAISPDNGSAFSTQTDVAKQPLHRLKYTCTVSCNYTLTRNPGAVLVAAGSGASLNDPLPLTAGTYTFVVDTGAGYTATASWVVGTFSTVIANDSPAGWWRFNDATSSLTATDSSGNGLLGNFQNPSSNGGTGISGDLDAARKFLAGEGGYVAVEGVEAKTEAYTIELWFKTATGDLDDMALFDHGAHGGGPALYLVGNDVRYRTVDGQVMSAGFTRGAWTHVAATWDGVSARLYVDGVAPGSAMATSLSPSGKPALYIGFANVGLESPAFRGLMDEVSYYGKALSAERVYDHYLADPPPPAQADGPTWTADSSNPQAAAPDKSAAARQAKARARAKAKAKAKAKALARARAHARAKAKAKARKAKKARSHRRAH